MKRSFLFILLSLTAAIIFFPAKSFCQQPPPPPPPPVDTPIDGGLTLLLAAGAAYGISKVKGKKNTKART